jgi:hypothetical protein
MPMGLRRFLGKEVPAGEDWMDSSAAPWRSLHRREEEERGKGTWCMTARAIGMLGKES